MRLVVLGGNEKSGNFFSSRSDVVCVICEQICKAITGKHDVLGAGTKPMIFSASRALSCCLVLI